MTSVLPYRGAVGTEKSFFLISFLFLMLVLYVTCNILWAAGVSAAGVSHTKAVMENHHSLSM